MQAAIYDDLGAAHRRELHRGAAGLLGGTAALRHRIAAADGPDPELAADLEAIAREELRRGRTPVAAAQLRTCLDLTAPGPERRPRLLSAVEVLLIAGDAITAAVPSAAWVIRHASDMEFVTVDLADVTAVCTRRAVRGPGITHDVVVELRGGTQHRIGSHATSTRAEVIADRVRHRLGTMRGRIRGNRAPERW